MTLDQLSFAALVEQFGNLPATSQAALIMAAFFGVHCAPYDGMRDCA
jgi:hypothetical protein